MYILLQIHFSKFKEHIQHESHCTTIDFLLKQRFYFQQLIHTKHFWYVHFMYRMLFSSKGTWNTGTLQYV